MSKKQFFILGAAAVVVLLFFFLDLHQVLTLENIKARQVSLTQQALDNPIKSSVLFFGLYVLVTAVSLPGAGVLTLAAGAVFGFWWALLLVSFASTIGATFAMLAARYLLRDYVQRHFESQLQRINEGMDREGAFYLFSLRLVVVVPFFIINLAMGLTSIRVPVFYLVSQTGMLAGTMVYVNAGTELADITHASDIFSGGLIVALALLGLLPLLGKKVVDVVRGLRVYQDYDRPASYDRDVIVIGAGSGGLVASLIAATVRARVTLIERNRMGGDCLNTGCVPSKALIRSARLAADIRRGPDLGFPGRVPDVDFEEVMERVQRIISEIEPHDSVERYEGLGVSVEIGEATILSPFRVRVNGQELTTRNIIIATGAGPFIPPIKGIEDAPYVTSDTIWSLRERPERLVVLGGGPIGCEMTQAFARLGSRVTQVERAPRIMTREDPEVSALVSDSLRTEGVDVLTGYGAEEVLKVDGGYALRCVNEIDGNEKVIPFDQLLVAVGRKANVTGFGLEELGVALTDRGTIAVDDYLATNFPNVYAIGDVAGPYQFTHTASHMAWYAAVNALFGTFWKFRVDYSVVPWCTFTSPEVARVGVSETEAREQGLAHEVTLFDVGELDRAIADEEGRGFVKVITKQGTDRILGVTIVADHAGDLISEYILAMKHGLGLKDIMGTIHIYPTLAEMNKFAASEWRKAHKPDWALALAEKYHTFRRGKATASVSGKGRA